MSGGCWENQGRFSINLEHRLCALFQPNQTQSILEYGSLIQHTLSTKHLKMLSRGVDKVPAVAVRRNRVDVLVEQRRALHVTLSRPRQLSPVPQTYAAFSFAFFATRKRPIT